MQEYWEYLHLQTITTVKVAFLKANPNTDLLEMLQRVIGQKICAFLMHKFGRLYRYGGGQFSTIQMGVFDEYLAFYFCHVGRIR